MSCPRADQHTPSPQGYMQWHEWARQMSYGHRQTRCPACRLFVVWKTKGVAKPVLTPAREDRLCLTNL